MPVPDLMQGCCRLQTISRMRPLWHVKIDLSPASANPRVSAAAAMQHVDVAAEYGGVAGGRITGGLTVWGTGWRLGVALHLIPAVDGVDDGSSTFYRLQ